MAAVNSTSFVTLNRGHCEVLCKNLGEAFVIPHGDFSCRVITFDELSTLPEVTGPNGELI